MRGVPAVDAGWFGPKESEKPGFCLPMQNTTHGARCLENVKYDRRVKQSSMRDKIVVMQPGDVHT